MMRAFLAATMVTGALTFCRPVRATNDVAAATPRVPAPRQVADDITRRMHRMGLNVLRAPAVQPYDGPGAVCDCRRRGDFSGTMV